MKSILGFNFHDLTKSPLQMQQISQEIFLENKVLRQFNAVQLISFFILQTVGWRIYWYCREKLHVKQFFGVIFSEWKSKSRDAMYDRENQSFKSEIMF